MKDKKIKIRANKNGPYTVEGASQIKSSQGDVFPLNSQVHLCRCGKSKNKPFCDKTHIESGFCTNKLEGRQPDKIDIYEGKQISIFDNRGICSHRGNCSTHLPKVFFQGKEPWIDPQGAAIGTTALMAIGCQQYRMCDTGKCPTGITIQDPLLRSRIKIKSASERLGRFLEVTRTEFEVFMRMTGNTLIHKLSIDDLSTIDPVISQVTGIRLG